MYFVYTWICDVSKHGYTTTCDYMILHLDEVNIRGKLGANKKRGNECRITVLR